MAKQKTLEPAREPGTDLAVVPSLLAAAPADDPDDFGALVGGQPARTEPKSVQLIRINHPARKLEYGGELVDSVEGYPLHWFQGRSWWESGYTPGSHNPPDCWSPDGVKPSPRSESIQSESCLECPWSKFGSAAVGRGPACKTQTLLFLVNPAFGTPPIACLILPPTSIRTLLGGARVTGYLHRARGFKQPNGQPAKYYETVWTRVSVEPPEPSAIYCVAQFQPVAVCPTIEEKRALASLRGTFIQAMESLRGEMPRVAEDDSAE